jgi:O-antigen/teichoic acid export membrane protein
MTFHQAVLRWVYPTNLITEIQLRAGKQRPLRMKKLSINLALSYSSTLIGFLIVLVLARILGAKDFSWVALGLAIGGFIVPLFNLGSDRTFVRDVVAQKHVSVIDEMVLSNLGQRTFMLLPICIALFGITMVFTNEISDAVALMGFSLWAGLIGLYPASWFDYSHDVSRHNLIVLGERSVCLLLICVIYGLADKAPEILAIGMCLLTTRVLSIFLQVRAWWVNHSSIPFSIRFLPVRQNQNGTNLHITMATVANAFLTYGNQLLLASNANPIELSSYSLAFQMMMIVFLFQAQAIRLSSRSTMEACRSRKALLQSMARNAGILFAGSTILACGAWIVIQILPHILADARFGTMSKIALPLCIWVVIAGAGFSVSQHSLALEQERFFLLTSLAGACMALLLGSLFIPHYGALAVAVILLIVHSSMMLINTIWLIYSINAKKSWGCLE